MDALDKMILQKKKILRAYNNEVRGKQFKEGNLVRKLILPIGINDRVFDKWSANWEEPFKVYQELNCNAYWLASLDREPHYKYVNGRYLKRYFPTMWKNTQLGKVKQSKGLWLPM